MLRDGRCGRIVLPCMRSPHKPRTHVDAHNYMHCGTAMRITQRPRGHMSNRSAELQARRSHVHMPTSHSGVSQAYICATYVQTHRRCHCEASISRKFRTVGSDRLRQCTTVAFDERAYTAQHVHITLTAQHAGDEGPVSTARIALSRCARCTCGSIAIT